jgi:hypothetical protein
MADTLSPPAVARRWGCKPSRVVALCRAGALRAFTLSPPTARRPRWRITAEAVREFEARQHVSQAPPQRRRKRDVEIIKFF